MTQTHVLDVAVDTSRPDAALNGGVVAVLHEIAALLERFLDSGEAGAIDLRSLPLTHADRRQLAEALGPGELKAELDALGPSIVKETGCRGVWWIEHRNARDELLAESIEINSVPGILRAPPEEMQSDLASLKQRIRQPSAGSGQPQDGEDAS